MRLLVLPLAALLTGCLGLPTPAPGASEVTYDAMVVETELGAFTAIAYCDETPLTCAFMRDLVEAGYYDGRAFGRIIPGFVIQEVDRTGGTTDHTGTVEAEFGRAPRFSAGALGIARNSDPNSGGSEFFVMDFATSHLYGNFTAFGQVVEGLDVVHAIARVPAARTGPANLVGSPEGSPVAFGIHDRVPLDPVQMTRVTWETRTLPAAEAARYPLQVAESYRTDTLRATLEWPADLQAGADATLMWYLLPRDTTPQGTVRDAPPIDLDGATITYAGARSGTLGFNEDPLARGALTIRWTPEAAGDYTFKLADGAGTTLALANMTVPG